jgi:hypothetical protein
MRFETMAKTYPDYRAPGALRRFKDEKWADFNARQREAQLAAKPLPRRKRVYADWDNQPPLRNRRQESYEDRLDDLGESPDY